MDKKLQTYEIRVEGHLSPRRLRWLEGLRVALGLDGQMVLKISVPDQSALYGLLNWLRDLGVPLVSVRRLEEDESLNAESQRGRDAEK